MRLFKTKDIAVTIFSAALALERNPAAVEAIVDAGYDIYMLSRLAVVANPKSHSIFDPTYRRSPFGMVLSLCI